MPVYLELFHGRDTNDAEMDDWGYKGPVLGPFKWIHTTYGTHIKALTAKGDKTLQIWLQDDLLPYGGKN